MDLTPYLIPAKTPAEAHAPAVARGADCSSCPLYGCKRGPVMGEIRPNSRLTIVGEAPGTREVELRKPFIGPSGDELEIALQDGGLRREDTSITNVLLCQPEGGDMNIYLEELNRKYRKDVEAAVAAGTEPPPAPKTPMACCAPRLERDIAEANAKVILAVGGKALQAMADHFNVPYNSGADETGRVIVASIKQQHGSPIPMEDGRILCSSLHPAFAMRENAYKFIVRANIARAARIVTRGYIDWSEPQFSLFPSVPEIVRFCRELVETKSRVTLDIETDSADVMRCRVRCVGFGTVVNDQERIMVIPLLWMDGRRYWDSFADEDEVKEAIRLVLDNCELIAHNGQFDTGVCQRVGLMSKPEVFKPSMMKTYFDTMVAHHDTDANDLPHDLGFVARQYLESPLWKKDVDHKAAVGTAKDSDLHLYNARDVLTTMRIAGQLERDIALCGTSEQFETDTKLGPIAREMTNLGMPVDENRRGFFSERFNGLTRQLEADFQRAAGKPINPRSPAQLGSWLFGDKKVTPPFNTSGFEWKEGQEWSTSTPALLQLRDKKLVDEEVGAAIDALLAYRACETVRGRYLDGLQVYFYPDDPVLSKAGLASAVEFGSKVVLPARPAVSVIHPSWKIHVVPTGRWSSSPNVQNVPSRSWPVEKDENGRDIPTNLRTMFAAVPDHVFVAADMDQVELRIYAAVAGDRLLLKAFNDGLDPHTLNLASLMAPRVQDIMDTYNKFNAMKSGSDKDKADLKYFRTIAKRFAFLEIYGGKENKLFQTMSSDRDKATNTPTFGKNLDPNKVRMWHRRWHDAHPETRLFHEDVARDLRELKYVEVPGLDFRKRFFRGGTTQENAPPNMRIQGRAASGQNLAVIRVTEEIPFYCWSRWTGLINQVHDQLILQVPASRGDEAKDILEKCMWSEIEIKGGGKLALTASAKISKNWAKAD